MRLSLLVLASCVLVVSGSLAADRLLAPMTEIPEVKLKSRTLRLVKVMSFTKTEMRLIHADGIETLATSEVLEALPGWRLATDEEAGAMVPKNPDAAALRRIARDRETVRLVNLTGLAWDVVYNAVCAVEWCTENPDGGVMRLPEGDKVISKEDRDYHLAMARETLAVRPNATPPASAAAAPAGQPPAMNALSRGAPAGYGSAMGGPVKSGRSYYDPKRVEEREIKRQSRSAGTLPSPLLYYSATQHRVQSNDMGAGILILSDDSVWQVLGNDRFKLASWLPSHGLRFERGSWLTHPTRIINVARDEAVNAKIISNGR